MDKPLGKEINFVRCLKCGKIFKCSRYDTAALLQHIRTDHPEIYIVDTDKTKYVPETEDAPTNYAADSKTKIGCSCFGCSGKSHENNSNSHETEDTEYEVDSEPDFAKEKYKSEPQYAKDIDLTHYSVTSEILEKYPEIKECEYCPRNPNANVVYTRRYKVYTPTATSVSTTQETPKKCKLYRTSIEKWRPANGAIYCPKCGCTKRPLMKTRAERFTYNECGACCLLSCWPFCFFPCLIPRQNLEYLHCSNCKNFLGLYDRNKNCIRPNRLFANNNLPNENNIDAGSSSGGSDKDSDATENVSNIPEKDSSKQYSHPRSTQKSPRLPSIVIDGKELHPNMVERLQKFKKYSSLAGIDLDNVIDKESSDVGNRDTLDKGNIKAADKTPSVGKTSKANDKNNI